MVTGQFNKVGSIIIEVVKQISGSKIVTGMNKPIELAFLRIGQKINYYFSLCYLILYLLLCCSLYEWANIIY